MTADTVIAFLVGLALGVTSSVATFGVQMADVKRAMKDMVRRIENLEPAPGSHFHRRATDDDA